MDTNTNVKYTVEGFNRRPPPPASDSNEIIEISSDDESGDESGVAGLTNMPIADLEIKREQIQRELMNNDENETEENDDFRMNRANAITEPDEKQRNEQVSNTLGQQTPQPMDHQHYQTRTPSNLSSGIGSIVNNYDSISESDDDFDLDLRPPNQISQMSNFSSPKVQFRVNKSDQKQNPIKPEKSTNETKFRMPLKSLSENFMLNDDATQMVPEQNYTSSSYQDQIDEQFSTENGFGNQYSTTPTLFEQQTTSTLFRTPVHQPNNTTQINYNSANVKPNHSYVNNIDMNNEQRPFGSPLSSLFLEHGGGGGGGTPLYATTHGKGLDDFLNEKIEDYLQNRLMKRLEEEGMILMKKDEYLSLKKEERKRNSSSPENSSEDQSPVSSSSKRKKSSQNHQSSSVKTEKSTHKFSTVTSGSLNLSQSYSNGMDYENDQFSSSSNDTEQIFFRKETKSGAPSSSGKINFQIFFTE